MRIKKLGNSELELTVVGLGTWAIGGPWEYGWGPQNDQDSMDAIFEAMDQGINWIDTAAIYGCGHAEVMIGRAIKQMSQKPIIATKCGLLWDERLNKINMLKKDSVIKECEDSLRRLDIDVIDLYQIHWPVPDTDVEQAWEAITQLIQQGKIRYGGVCNFTKPQLKRISPIHPPVSLQPPYSMLQRGIEKELVDYCRDHNMGILAYSPMHKGLLTGKFNHEYLKTLSDDDHRKSKDLNFKEPRFSKNLEIVEKLKNIATENGKTIAQLAIAWVLRLPEVTSAIVGARKKGQISQTAPAADWDLDEVTIKKIEDILP